jgi:SAM-dependent methyltransferase
MQLSAIRKFRFFLPRSLRPTLKGMLAAFTPWFKYQEEIGFWREYRDQNGGTIPNEHYERTMVGMSGGNADFLAGKIVADFDCGPAGSLNWARAARLRIGIDALADHYAEFGIASHPMVYVVSSERRIPLPSNYVDVMFTMNAMDHVAHFPAMCKEIVRILAPGGLLIASVNLDEPPTFSEPQTLTEQSVRRFLLGRLLIESYRTAAHSSAGSTYENFFIPGYVAPESGQRFLWVRARKSARFLS